MLPIRLASLAVPVAAALSLLAAGALLAQVPAANLATCDVPGDHPTIQSAVDDPICDVVNVAAGTFYENVVIGRDVTVVGQGTDSTIVDGSGSGRVFTIQPGLGVTLTNLTVRGGVAGRGGGIATETGSALALVAVGVVGNTSAGSWPDGGGGILNAGSLTIADSTLSDNHTLNGNRGGGILSLGALTTTGTAFIGNLAYYGGAIYSEAGTATIANSTLSDNAADGPGGGIYNDGLMTVTGSTLSRNSTGGAFTAGGGAIRNTGWLTVTGSNLRDNVSFWGGGISNEPGGELIVQGSFLVNNAAVGGGGIYSAFDAYLTVVGSTFISNSASYSGGGIVTFDGRISSTTINGNSAGDGGAITSGGNLTVTDSLLNGNAADRGAGIWNLGALLVVNSHLSDNRAAHSGGAIYALVGPTSLIASTLEHNSAAIHGGGIYCSSGSVTVTNSTISSNSAEGSGGGIYKTLTSTLSLNNSTLNANAAAAGGGIYSEPGGTAVLLNTIVANSASGGECAGSPLSSLGYNVVSDGTCNLTAEGDQPNTDPLLGPLQDNGGPTWTHALLPGSPAIDAGNPAAPGSGGNACELTDQRGIPRPVDGDEDGVAVCDIGAFEVWVPTSFLYLPAVRLDPDSP